jgi:hypothetical protein
MHFKFEDQYVFFTLFSSVNLDLKIRILYGEELVKLKINGIYYDKLRTFKYGQPLDRGMLDYQMGLH